MAHELGLSPRTVEAHRAQTMRKLDVRTTAGLIAIVLHKRLPGGLRSSILLPGFLCNPPSICADFLFRGGEYHKYLRISEKGELS
ncbi:MAG: LuxR C-terminal-related transcriptional regulator [Nitrosomonadaceae bacterium]|nr:LuxR C-terminal-related transcriptional regulator [Nitrosomonadaceae bacterium]